jgi:hypothetical protein
MKMLSQKSVPELTKIIVKSSNDVWRYQAIDMLLIHEYCNAQAFVDILAGLHPPRITEYDEDGEVDLLESDNEIEAKLFVGFLEQANISTEQLIEAMKSTVSIDSRSKIQNLLLRREDLTCEHLVLICFEYQCDDYQIERAEKMLLYRPDITTYQLCLAGRFFTYKTDRTEAIFKLKGRHDAQIEYFRVVYRDLFSSREMRIAALTVLIEHMLVAESDLEMIAANSDDLELAAQAKTKLENMRTKVSK